MLDGKRIFITGGAGFIGTTLARELIDRNTIVAYDNLHRDALSGLDLADHPNFELIQGDILDAEALKDAAQGATHFVHCAAIAGVDTVLESPVRTMRVNVIGTYNALEAALATLPSLERFIDFSTSEVFGTHALNVEEGQVSTIGSVGEARWTYAVSKLAGEHMAHAYHDELKLPTVTVHPFNIFGPGQIGGGAIRAFIEAAIADRDLTIHGDGSQIRAWTYVDRHGRRRAALPRASGRDRADLQHRQPACRRDDLRPGAAHQADQRRERRDRLPAAALRGRRVAHPERQEGPRGARLGAGR